MQVQFDSRDPSAALLRDWAERRIRFVMRRLAWSVPRARVQLSDVNGPRGGVDKRCHVSLAVPGRGDVQVTALAGDWRSALDQALARAARVMQRSANRASRAWRRRPGQADVDAVASGEPR
jgi:hypothetical protein